MEIRFVTIKENWFVEGDIIASKEDIEKIGGVKNLEDLEDISLEKQFLFVKSKWIRISDNKEVELPTNKLFGKIAHSLID